MGSEETVTNRVRRRNSLPVVGMIIVLAIIADLIIFRLITDRPLGLQPSEPAASPRLNTWEEAAIVVDPVAKPGEPFILMPALALEATTSNGSSLFEVLSFGRKDGVLYLLVRLYESIDLSLDKGWGKSFQLTGSSGKNYLFNSHKLPNGVEINDSFVDLPNDFRGRQTVLAGNYRDLTLAFPEFPDAELPSRLRLVEAFQGESPANPGNVYAEVKIEKNGKLQETALILTGSPQKNIALEQSFAAIPGLSNTNILLRKMFVDELCITKVFLEVTAPKEREIFLLNAVLIDQNGANYNWFQLEDAVVLKKSGTDREEKELLFERLPQNAELSAIWINLTSGQTNTEIILKL